jgi:uncharacterized membrane protein YkoI
MLLAACAATFVVTVGPVAADDDHERARAALERGEILPLRVILERVGRDHPGTVVEVELEQEAGRWVYEIKLLQQGGSLVKLEVDAGSGLVQGIRARGRGGREISGGSN